VLPPKYYLDTIQKYMLQPSNEILMESNHKDHVYDFKFAAYQLKPHLVVE
jgi:hypothetical protein